MAVSEVIQLVISESLKNKGFRIIRDGQTIVLQDTEGNQSRSYIYKDWNKTVKKFEEQIEKTQIVRDKLTHQEILSCLSENNSLLKCEHYSGPISSYNNESDSESTTEEKKEKEEPPVQLTEDLTREIGFKEIEDILSTSIKHDEAAKVITFSAMLLAQSNEDQLNLGFQSESSAGKSYIPIEVSSYFPKNEVEVIASASPTSFYHDGGKWDEDRQVLIKNLEHKNLIFLDQPHFQLLEKLRPMLSHDMKDLHYKITDKNQRFGLRTKNVVIRGFPSVFFCTTKSDPDEQEKTRLLLLSPSTDQEKLRKSLELASLRKGNPEEYRKCIQQDPQRAWLMNRIKGIRQWGIREVIIPEDGKGVYDRFMKEHPHLMPRHQRDLPRVFSFIKAHALLNCFNREKKDVENKPDTTTIMATQADIDTGYELYGEIECSNELGLSPYIYNIFNDVFAPILDPHTGVTRDDILRKYYEVRHKTLSPETLKREIIPQLETVGLISQQTDSNDKRRVLIYPTVSTPIISPWSPQEEKDEKEKENDDEDSRGQDGGVNFSSFFWQIYNQLEQSKQPEPDGTKTVSESILKQKLVSSGKFTGGEATQSISDIVEKGELTRSEFDVLVRKSYQTCQVDEK